MNKIKYIGALLIAVAGLGLQKADAVQYTINVGNNQLMNAGFTGPYATVDVTLTDATHATVTFNSLTQTIGGNTFVYLMGDGASAAVQVNASSWTISGITGSNAYTGVPAFTPGPFSDGGAGNVDGFGTFNQTVNSFDGYTHSSSTITFTLTNTGGNWGSANAVLSGNPLVGAHIFVGELINGVLVNTTITGFASNGGTPTVPDGGTTVMLLGMALGALGMVRRYLIS
jgi:VPDSG-CTERM motif